MSDQLVVEVAIYTTNMRDEHPCPQRDSTPQPNSWRPTARNTGPPDLGSRTEVGSNPSQTITRHKK